MERFVASWRNGDGNGDGSWREEVCDGWIGELMYLEGALRLFGER